jgi:hypothetical protein
MIFVTGTLAAVCDVIDASGTGARLALDHTTSLPSQFVLFLSRVGTLHRQCRLVERDETRATVDFGAGTFDFGRNCFVGTPIS